MQKIVIAVLCLLGSFTHAANKLTNNAKLITVTRKPGEASNSDKYTQRVSRILRHLEMVQVPPLGTRKEPNMHSPQIVKCLDPRTYSLCWDDVAKLL